MAEMAAGARLPKWFIGFAGLNFLAGAVLGGWMAASPAAVARLAAIHGEINPFGWLTMMIYGTTYAVLRVFAGLRPPKAWLSWLHLAVSELAVVAVVIGEVGASVSFVRGGYVLQAVAPILFLVNILSTVWAARRERRQALSQPQSHSVLERTAAVQRTDRIARRGTDLALIVFIVAAVWMAVLALRSADPVDWTDSGAAAYWLNYGWIAGTLLAVSLHLFPRFTGIDGLNPRVPQLVQLLWGFSLFFGALGFVTAPACVRVASGLVGVAIILQAALYGAAMLRRRSRGDERRMTGAALMA
jgi:hypothetical protein